jgi:hypothetical protein
MADHQTEVVVVVVYFMFQLHFVGARVCEGATVVPSTLLLPSNMMC